MPRSRVVVSEGGRSGPNVSRRSEPVAKLHRQSGCRPDDRFYVLFVEFADAALVISMICAGDPSVVKR
jgi:hypothetical protein